MAGAIDVARARAGSQLLHRPPVKGGVAELVAHLLAVQAQDVAAFPLALRARAEGLTAAALVAAAWRTGRSCGRGGLRGTLHLMAAEDLALVVPLCGPPRVAASRRRAAQEGIADPTPPPPWSSGCSTAPAR